VTEAAGGASFTWGNAPGAAFRRLAPGFLAVVVSTVRVDLREVFLAMVPSLIKLPN